MCRFIAVSFQNAKAYSIDVSFGSIYEYNKQAINLLHVSSGFCGIAFKKKKIRRPKA